MSFLAALRESDRLVYLSERGVWLPPAAFSAAGSTHRLRVFRYEESARGVAEDWARKVAGMEPLVVRWDTSTARDSLPRGLVKSFRVDTTDLEI